MLPVYYVAIWFYQASLTYNDYASSMVLGQDTVSMDGPHGIIWAPMKNEIYVRG